MHLQPEVVRRVEKDLLNIMAGGTAENADILYFYLSFSLSNIDASPSERVILIDHAYMDSMAALFYCTRVSGLSVAV